jgi:hypothetical protein
MTPRRLRRKEARGESGLHGENGCWRTLKRDDSEHGSHRDSDVRSTVTKGTQTFVTVLMEYGSCRDLIM